MCYCENRNALRVDHLAKLGVNNLGLSNYQWKKPFA